MKLEDQMDIFMEGFFDNFHIKEWMLDEEDYHLLEEIVYQIASCTYDENCIPMVSGYSLGMVHSKEELRSEMGRYHLLVEDAFADSFEDLTIFNWFTKLIELFPETWENIQDDTAFIREIGFYDMKSWDEVYARSEALKAS